MTTKEIANQICDVWCNGSSISCKKGMKCEAFHLAMKVAEWKDQQPIYEQGGWHEEEPTEDGWYLVDTPDFPKNCDCIVAEWDNCAKRFYSEASDNPIEYCKWKPIKK